LKVLENSRADPLFQGKSMGKVPYVDIIYNLT
jgi:hypothetical protein